MTPQHIPNNDDAVVAYGNSIGDGKLREGRVNRLKDRRETVSLSSSN
jgi:hypothetical protein